MGEKGLYPWTSLRELGPLGTRRLKRVGTLSTSSTRDPVGGTPSTPWVPTFTEHSTFYDSSTLTGGYLSVCRSRPPLSVGFSSRSTSTPHSLNTYLYRSVQIPRTTGRSPPSTPTIPDTFLENVLPESKRDIRGVDGRSVGRAIVGLPSSWSGVSPP